MWIITKLKIKWEIFKSSNKFFFYKPFYNFFHIYNLSAKYYQENKERLPRYQNISKEEKGKKPWHCRGRYKDLSED